MLLLLIGAEGSGKSRIGALLEQRLDTRFLRVEPLWLEYHTRCRATGREPDSAQGIAHVHPAIRAALAQRRQVAVGTTGAPALVLDALLSLERPCHTLVTCTEALPAGLSDDAIVAFFAEAIDHKQKALDALRPPHDETLAARVRRLLAEEVVVAPYDPAWPMLFRQERDHLRACLPPGLIGRIEHFGSTAVPGLAAKPIIDMLVEVADLKSAREEIAPLLEARGYDYLWRPTHGDDGPPFYPWLIRRAPRTGVRTHHIHMVDASMAGHWHRLRFRDHLIAHPETAREYAALKQRLAAATPADRVSYTRGKAAFVERVTRQAGQADDAGR